MKIPLSVLKCRLKTALPAHLHGNQKTCFPGLKIPFSTPEKNRRSARLTNLTVAFESAIVAGSSAICVFCGVISFPRRCLVNAPTTDGNEAPRYDLALVCVPFSKNRWWFPSPPTPPPLDRARRSGN